MAKVTATIQKAMQEQNLTENHVTIKEREIGPMDASYHTMRVLPDCEEHRHEHPHEHVHKSTNKDNVKKITPLDTSYPTIQVFSDSKKLQTHDRMSAMSENTYREDKMNETYRENRNCAKDVMVTAPHYPRDRQTDTTSLALMARTCTRPKKIKMIAFAMEGEKGHN